VKTNLEIFDNLLDQINLVETSLVRETPLTSQDYYTIAERLNDAIACALILGDRIYKQENAGA